MKIKRTVKNLQAWNHEGAYWKELSNKRQIYNGEKSFQEKDDSTKKFTPEPKSILKKSSMDLTDHHVKDHPGKEPIQKSNQRIHTNEKQLSCKFCNEMMNSSMDLLHHFMNEHPEKQPIKNCLICNESMKSSMDLMDHFLKDHPDKEPIQKSNVMVQISNKQFQCNFCNEMLKSSMDLKDHLVKYHPEKGPKQKSNKRIQTNENQFPCKFCDVDEVVSF